MSFKFVQTNTQGQRLVNFRPKNPPTALPSNFHQNVVEVMISLIIGRRSTVIVWYFSPAPGLVSSCQKPTCTTCWWMMLVLAPVSQQCCFRGEKSKNCKMNMWRENHEMVWASLIYRSTTSTVSAVIIYCQIIHALASLAFCPLCLQAPCRSWLRLCWCRDFTQRPLLERWSGALGT